MNKAPLRGGVVLIVLVVAICVVWFLIDTAHAVRLSSAPALTGQVSQILAAKNDQHTLPVYGTDFKLSDTQYFEDGAWAVSRVESTPQADISVVVFQKKSGVYQVVLGPGTAFPESLVQNLPDQVSGYLRDRGAVYVPTN